MAATDLERFSRIILDEFKRVHERFDAVDGRLEEIERRLDSIEHEIGDIHRRLDAFTNVVDNHSGYAKEIDHLLKRIAAIEKHLGLQHSITA
jgi:tetrahydromethanopterin S-methyltransferase subunit G